MKSKTILVPTDFSDAARNATNYAIALAKAMNYELFLLHVYNTPVVVSTDMMGTLLVDTTRIEKEIRQRLMEEAVFLQEMNDIIVHHEAADGLVAEEIIEAEKMHHPALIIMGMKESNALSEYMLGSTSTDILLKIHTPLLIIPEKASFRKPERIVFAVDPYQDMDIKICDEVKDLMERFYSTVYILSILKDQEDASVTRRIPDDQLEKQLENRFHSYHSIEHEDVTEGINEFIAQHRIDMVIMLPQKHNFLAKLFKEPHTKKLAFHSSIPMLSLICEKK